MENEQVEFKETEIGMGIENGNGNIFVIPLIRPC